jgi:hypothetical protein
MKRKATSSKAVVARKIKRTVKTKKPKVKPTNPEDTSTKTTVENGEKPVAVAATRNAPKRRAFIEALKRIREMNAAGDL